jgi:hypothetical protein
MPGGYRLAQNLGHSSTEIAPSLFTFKIEDEILKDLSGTSFPQASLVLKIDSAKPFEQSGPLLTSKARGLQGGLLAVICR